MNTKASAQKEETDEEVKGRFRSGSLTLGR